MSVCVCVCVCMFVSQSHHSHSHCDEEQINHSHPLSFNSSNAIVCLIELWMNVDDWWLWWLNQHHQIIQSIQNQTHLIHMWCVKQQDVMCLFLFHHITTMMWLDRMIWQSTPWNVIVIWDGIVMNWTTQSSNTIIPIWFQALLHQVPSFPQVRFDCLMKW